MANPAGAHVFPLRVYYEDTDAGGIVYHANYLRFAERARTEILREKGVNQSQLVADEGIGFAVRHCTADYVKPGRLDDRLEVHTRIVEVGRGSVRCEQSVKRDGTDLVTMRLRLVCLNLKGRPARLPAGVRAALLDHCNTNQQVE